MLNVAMFENYKIAKSSLKFSDILVFLGEWVSLSGDVAWRLHI